MSSGGFESEDQQTEHLADAIDEEIELLVRVTEGPPGLTSPETVYRILGKLTDIATRLSQTAGQLDDFLLGELEAERLEHFYRPDPSLCVLRAHVALAKATEHAHNLSHAFGSAQYQINSIGSRQASGPKVLETMSEPTRNDHLREDFPKPIGELLATQAEETPNASPADNVRPIRRAGPRRPRSG